VVGDNRPRLYWSVAACQCLGGIPVMMYQDAVAQEMAYVMADAEIRFACVEDQEQVDKMLEVKDGLPLLEHVLGGNDRSVYKPHSMKRGSKCQIIKFMFEVMGVKKRTCYHRRRISQSI